jgi:predicted short-subunit dehydrogenase-like oxidoreductase (DUF2520 family)
VLGASRLGTTLAGALARAGHAIAGVASRTPASAQAFAARLGGAARPCEPAELVARCDLVFVAVPDLALVELAAALPWRTGQMAVHCSGALDLAVLDPARARGALRGCLHPLQSFPERFGAPSRFEGITCGIEGDGALATRLERICAELGARALPLSGVDRAAYHAAAVLAGNYVVALHAAAERAFALAGLPPEEGRTALAPLTLGAADNVHRLPLAEALTGPIARADTATIARQLAALSPDPELRALYARLGAALLALPLPLAKEQRAALEALLRNEL